MALDSVIENIIKEVGESALSFYHPSRDFIINDTIFTEEDGKKITLD